MNDRTLTKRLLLLAAILAIGAGVWFMLGESEHAKAGESGGRKAVDAGGDSGGSGSSQDGDKVLARVNGTEITAAQVEDSIAGQLLQWRRDRHTMIEQAVENHVRETLFDAEAKKRGISKDELIATEIDGKVDQVSDAEVDAFYQARRQQIRAPKEQVEQQIRKYLRFESFVGGLKSAAEIEILTDPFRVDVAAVGPSKGPEDAPVTIVEFSDFECPFCSRVTSSIDKIRETYGDRVQVVFRQFPLDIHSHARKAGEAALCAGEQGQFWAMHDAMFGNQKSLGVDGLKSLAAGIGELDAAAFNACLDSGKHADAVQKDVEAGMRAGVGSTPSFFINGRFLSGAQPYESFAEVIDDELERVGAS
jgi:protein-disulfide isomerase